MRLKSFHGSNLSEAMRQVREALGDNAIIVATRDDDAGGVRVTAAIDDVPAAGSTASVSPAGAAAQPEGTEAIETIAEALTRHQLPTSLAEKMMASATQFANDDPILALGAACDAHFKFQPIADDKGGKPLILIGPPGAGKTLCIAKLATKATLAKRSITVVSTDFERAGGIEQLTAFTRLLKVNLVEIEDAHALRDLIAMQKASHVFIDTAGSNPFNDAERKYLQAMVGAAGGEAMLVLPAGLDANEALDITEAFHAIGATRVLLTRLDMTRRLGSALGAAYESKLPLANFSASSKVTESPQPLNPVALARLVLHGVEAKPAAEAPAAAKSGR
jgi:flagellar biosynthesis protein FlhF